ncbi:hypothetical protein [Rhizohabitans arisaemae]|uniref:hypothetical protein n=1 Tax=Rhizohabitans arisaemae TaxID=2720610 RepID=UPI0024B044FA|nr:hypothetical protein [Rhizohabitans arisaemae]
MLIFVLAPTHALEGDRLLQYRNNVSVTALLLFVVFGGITAGAHAFRLMVMKWLHALFTVLSVGLCLVVLANL